MRRLDALRGLHPELEKCVVVTIMGATAAELYSLGHRPGFFYLEHAMGLASSMGLGIAVSRPELTVVVLDGDGSLLMNLGSLTTLARYRPPNLVHLVFDNQVLLSVGKSFTTATAGATDLAAVAAGAGVPRTATVESEEELLDAFRAARKARELTTLVAKIDTSGPASYHIDLHMLENRFQFQRHLATLAEGRDQARSGGGAGDDE